jgi:hypothetical protein
VYLLPMLVLTALGTFMGFAFISPIVDADKSLR